MAFAQRDILYFRSEQGKCPICLQLAQLPTVLECGHFFCLACVKEWQDDEKFAHLEGVFDCPCCRQPRVNNDLPLQYVTDISLQRLFWQPTDYAALRRLQLRHPTQLHFSCAEIGREVNERAEEEEHSERAAKRRLTEDSNSESEEEEKNERQCEDADDEGEDEEEVECGEQDSDSDDDESEDEDDKLESYAQAASAAALWSLNWEMAPEMKAREVRDEMEGDYSCSDRDREKLLDFAIATVGGKLEEYDCSEDEGELDGCSEDEDEDENEVEDEGEDNDHTLGEGSEDAPIAID